MKAKIVVASHLSDMSMEMNMECENPKATEELRETAKLRLNFVKFLINKLNGDLTQDIDPDELFEEFNNL